MLTNFGRLPQLVIDGEAIGRRLHAAQNTHDKPEQGSIIIIVATDAPLDARQLRRVAAELVRTGSTYGHGSGDIALAFSTAYTVAHDADFIAMPPLLNDACLDPLFRAAANVEQAIIDVLFSAETVIGRNGHRRISLNEALEKRSSKC